MWYNFETLSRAVHQAFLPSGRILTEADFQDSPIDGWEWLADVPQWYKDAYPDQFPEEA